MPRLKNLGSSTLERYCVIHGKDFNIMSYYNYLFISVYEWVAYFLHDGGNILFVLNEFQRNLTL